VGNEWLGQTLKRAERRTTVLGSTLPCAKPTHFRNRPDPNLAEFSRRSRSGYATSRTPQQQVKRCIRNQHKTTCRPTQKSSNAELVLYKTRRFRDLEKPALVDREAFSNSLHPDRAPLRAQSHAHPLPPTPLLRVDSCFTLQKLILGHTSKIDIKSHFKS